MIPTLLSLARSPIAWVVVAAVLAASALAVQSARLNAAKARVAQYQTMLDAQIASTRTAINANEECLAVVSDLEAQLSELVGRRKIEAEAAAHAIQVSLADRDAALARAQEARRARDALWQSTQSCQGLAAHRIDVACGDVADRLRERTAAGGD